MDGELKHLKIRHGAGQMTARKTRMALKTFFRHDFKAGLTVFFVALPLCLGVALASGVPVYSGLISGIVGGLVISLLSNSPLSVSGPAAGLTAITVHAIRELGSVQLFFLAVMLAGVLQILIGVLKAGEFTHFIPSSVIKGMLAGIGLLLISKQIPFLIGYNKPEFWMKELFNVMSFSHNFDSLRELNAMVSLPAFAIGMFALAVLIIWKKYISHYLSFVPASFMAVLAGSFAALLCSRYCSSFFLSPDLFVNIPQGSLSQVRLPSDWSGLSNPLVWKNAAIIGFVASLETLLSIEAIDKLDPLHRITGKNREMMAQGAGNILSGLLYGLPITAVIVRSSANAEAGGRTWRSSFSHGFWLLLTLLLLIALVNRIPYCVLAVLLIRTGYNLAKPSMIADVYRQGREQLFPFLVTVGAVLFTDLLTGVFIGVIYALYYLVKHTYRAGFVIEENDREHHKRYTIDLALNVSFLNKKKLRDALDKIPAYSEVMINGADSVYIDHDVLEIIHEFKLKAKQKHMVLQLNGVPEVKTLSVHTH